MWINSLLLFLVRTKFHFPSPLSLIATLSYESPAENEAYAPRPPGDGSLYAVFRKAYLEACGDLGLEEKELGLAFVRSLEKQRSTEQS